MTKRFRAVMQNGSPEFMKRRIISLLLILSLLSITLTGCGEWVQYFYSEAHCERIAKKCLKEYFGEDFVVKGMYSQYWKQFNAYCSPVRDESIIFEAKFSKSGYLIYEHYLEGIISKQIEDVLHEHIDSIWKGTLIIVNTGRDNNVAIKYRKHPQEMTIEEYMSIHENDHGTVVDIFIPEESFESSNIDIEYNLWKNTIEGVVKERKIPRFSVSLWVVDNSQMNYINSLFSKQNRYDSLQLKKFGSKTTSFGYYWNTLDLKLSYEEYSKARANMMDEK